MVLTIRYCITPTTTTGFGRLRGNTFILIPPNGAVGSNGSQRVFPSACSNTRQGFALNVTPTNPPMFHHQEEEKMTTQMLNAAFTT
jgi:hypothetical protein